MKQIMPVVISLFALPLFVLAQNSSVEQKKVVPYVPTPPEIVSGMLKLANVGKQNLLIDLGCGDGRIVIAAAKEFGAHAIGIDIDPERIKEANANAQKEGVTSLVEFRQGVANH